MNALLLTILALSAAQAGGGGSFGGGGGGGGGDGDNGWIFEILFWLIRLAIEVPLIGVPLLIVVVVLFLVGARNGWWKHQERTIHRNAPALAARRSVAPLAALRQNDPNFDEQRFLARVTQAFEKAQRAWCAQDLEPLRPFVSDGVFERFSLQILEQREQGWRQGMDGLAVARPIVQHVETGRVFETLVVRIPFSADIHRVALDGGRRMSGSELPRRHFEECWSFVRRRGAKTANGAGLIEGQCPNCGAPLGIAQSGQCGSCRALVRSGEFDWVLAEITQASEWAVEDERGVRGLAELATRDPGLSIQLLEDRASVAFWRWSAAERKGVVDPLLRIADAGACERLAVELSARTAQERSELVERAVGSVRTLGILPGEERDLAVVEIVWDGRPVVLAGGARASSVAPVRADERRALRKTLFVLARRAGLTTDVRETFASSRCGTCGAHDSGGTDALCPYCGAPRTGDAAAWFVTAILGAQDAAALRLRAELEQRPSSAARPVRPSAAGLLAWVVAATRSDGHVDERERRVALRLGERFGVQAERIDALLAGNVPEVEPELPRDASEARAWLSELCELALLDGTLHRGEQLFLRHAAERFSIHARELEALLGAKRSELYRAT